MPHIPIDTAIIWLITLHTYSDSGKSTYGYLQEGEKPKLKKKIKKTEGYGVGGGGSA